MLVFYVLSLFAGFALGVRLMQAGVLREGPAERAREATAPRAQARLVSPIAAAMLATFGLVGGVLTRLSVWGPGLRFLVSFLAAGAALALAALVRRWALDPDAPASTDEDPRYVVQGLPALVTRAIEAARSGEITWRRDGRTEVTPARTIDGADLAAGTEVVIERLENGVAWVESWRRVEARL
ncbi:MAG: hypothetical protein HY275_15195 [Gemmatimonadetes bacterium]|nr:hypothetical protein [Gemmatimonadota bacterium]